jgi:2-keto-3-deoxy-L-rhamnonate aldolase RhmA
MIDEGASRRVPDIFTNRTKAKLARGESVYGCAIRYPDAGLVEMLGAQGFDFVFFDGEHGVLEPATCEHMVRAAEAVGTTPIVRVPTNEPHVILRYLETGVQGCQVPWVNSADDAERSVAAIKYGPRGKRGLAGSRVNRFGQVPFSDYVRRANEETLVVVQIESGEAVDRIDEIAAVPDVDVVFIGSTDLAQDLGFPGQPDHPDVIPKIERVIAATLAAGKTVGVVARTAADGPKWEARGARYVLAIADNLIGAACQQFLETARGAGAQP